MIAADSTTIVEPTLEQREADRELGAVTRRQDRGAILNFVLVTVVVCSLIAVPVLGYITTVLRAGSAQGEQAQALSLAEGGLWVALSNERELFNMCGAGAFQSSLEDVTTTCSVLETTTQYAIERVPFGVATVRADTAVPASLATGSAYVNPNTAADPATWMARGDWTADSAAGKVWLPQLPVQSTGSGRRDFEMPAGTFDPAYSHCRVLFPGSYTTPLVLDGPTYFTSGVYYVTQPIVLRDGADVVVGGGAATGCTDDFEGVASLPDPPNPLNITGLGGTLIFGDQGRITVEDDGSGEISFAMNQRFVSDTEVGVAASAGVSVISVNGDHGPFAGAGALGDDLVIPGVLAVPASTVAVDGSPRAAASGYLPSILTPKPIPPAVVPSVPDAIVDLTTTTGTRLDVNIAGYVSVPQGRIAISAADPAAVAVRMRGGVLAGQIDIDEAQRPESLTLSFDNPVGQKRILIRSVYSGEHEATAEAVIQINRSGTVGVNSWVVRR